MTASVDKPSTKLVWVFVGLFGGGGLGSLLLYANLWTKHRVEWWGPLGDSLAPVAGLMSATALGAAIASVVMQTRELAMQRKEFEASRRAQERLGEETARASEISDRTRAVLEAANAMSAERLQWDKEVRSWQASGDAVRLQVSLLSVLGQLRSAEVHAAAATVPGTGSNPVSKELREQVRKDAALIEGMLKELEAHATVSGPREPPNS